MRTALALALALTAAPAIAAAQGGPPGGGRGMGGRGMTSPVQMMLDNGERLSLTEDQVTRLTAIQERWTTETAPLRARMDSARAQMQQGGDRQAMMETVRPIMTDMRTRNDAARTEAMAVLSETQRTTFEAIEAESRPQGGPGRRP